MKCKCGSKRIISVSGKCSDMCVLAYYGTEICGYVPQGVGISNNEDYLDFSFCLDCGKIQGEFPISEKLIDNIFTKEE